LSDQKTLLDLARAGEITPEMQAAAKTEGVTPEFIRAGMVDGNIVVTSNRVRKNVKPLAIGAGLRIKVNANIGTSGDHHEVAEEMEKLRACEQAGADTVMDLSTGGPLRELRQAMIENTDLPIGTVPIYQAMVDVVESGRKMVQMKGEDLLACLEEQGREGVDFMTVHCGVTQRSIGRIMQEGRVLDVVSRGGSLTVGWMHHNQAENPLYEQYDRVIDIARKYEVVLSLGDGLRPGCLADATDRGQIEELVTLGELCSRARDAGVQVMIEGPGHVPMNQIVTNIQLQKRLCHGAPFYVLGPLVTDVAPGYDHITAAIGGAIAGAAGADFICYVTPSEHLRLPTVEDVREGVIAARIAGHAADIARGLPGALAWDRKMAVARKALDWEAQIACAIDPDKARAFRAQIPPSDQATCSMCGELCAIKVARESMGKKSI
jgi:phosphomethylpyrimidine synthase